MAADIVKFSAAIDKVYKTFSTQEVQFEQKELKGRSERGTMQYIEQKFQQQLQRARAAFLQEFRNHSVVVESEVRKIRQELTEQLEEKYGDRIAQLREKTEEASALVLKHKDEIAQLKSLTTAQETYLAAVRQRWGLEQQEKLRAEIQQLKEELEASKKEKEDLSHQLVCRNELVGQLGGELSGLEGEIKRQASDFSEEKRVFDERIRGLRLEMRQQQDAFQEHIKQYEERFAEYRAKTEAELQLQDILNKRRSEALVAMEEERQLHIKARTKPSSRIGPSGDEDSGEGQDESSRPALAKDTRYRVDDMGMDTSWRDYQLGDLTLVPRKPQPPTFRADRTRRAAPARPGPNPPTATETPRSGPVMALPTPR